MKETYVPRSSHIARVDYDSDEKTLTVAFDDASEYQYSNVPVSVFLGIQNAASAGQYFHRQIRDRYASVEV